ncbi:hypothetical protein KJ786_00850 [Patescibacteria group bacterium]|nr:hypothetical protein [Patescibacteria group bacterium]
MADQKRLLIIDSNALLHRAFHALPPLATKNGEQTGAVYGFLLTLFKAIKDLNPGYIVACFDTPAPTFRHKRFKEYKAQRPKTPGEIVTQIPKTKEILEVFKIPIFAKEGFEADDLIATIAVGSSKKKELSEIYILSGDLDNIQLVNNIVKVYTLGRGIKDTVIYDEEKVFSRYSIKSSQMIDFKAMVGDSSDNIPGVLGIGQKTASELLQKFSNLENIYKEIKNDNPDIKHRIKEILLKYKEQALLARELVEMKKDVDMDFNLEQCRFNSFNKKEVESVFSKFEFNSLINKLPLAGDQSNISKQKSLL